MQVNPAPGVQLTVDELLSLRQQATALDLSSKYQVSSTLAGGYRSKFRGRGMDFDEVRLYQPGDDIRNIDWRVTARTGKAHTKLFKEERERPVFILVDQSPRLFFGSRVAFKSVIAARAAALLVWACINAGSRIGGIIFNDEDHLEHRPSGRRREALSFLRKITERHNQVVANINKTPVASNPEAFAQSLSRLRRLAKPGSLIYLFSDFNHISDDARRHMAHLCRHNDIQAYMLTDPLDRHLPPVGTYAVTDGQSIGQIHTGSRSMTAAYEEAFDSKVAALQELFKQHKILFEELSTTDDLKVVLAAANAPRIMKQ
jgi:uncharacterized protein (DUF58 family)